jgi:hypothetical protein
MPVTPNREADLARPRSRKGSDQQETKRGTMLPVEIPDEDPEWHAIAKMLWRSLLTSGQRDFYQNTDWAFAYSLCEDITRYKEPRELASGDLVFKRSPEMLKALQAAMGSLLMTEADRRKVRVELHEPEPTGPSAAVSVMESYRTGLSAPSEAQSPEEGEE